MASTISFKKKPVAAPANATPAEAAAPTTPAANAPVVEVKATPVADPVGAVQSVKVTNVPPPQPPVSNAHVAPGSEQFKNPTTSAQLATQSQSTELADPAQYKGVGGFEGEFSAKDMATPYLALFQKSSKGFEDHMDWLGQWVYDKEIPLGNEIKVVFLRASKFYVEKTEFGSDKIPQRFTRMQDARTAGFNESSVQEAADLDLLIEVDRNLDGVAELAHLFDGDKAYILTRYSVRSTSYGRTVGILAKDSSGFLKGNLINGFYVMTTEKRTGDKGTYYIPTLKTAGRTPDSLRSEIVERMSTVG